MPAIASALCVELGLVFVRRPVRAVVAVVGWELGSSFYRVLDREDKADGSSLGWSISSKTVSGQGVGGAFESDYRQDQVCKNVVDLVPCCHLRVLAPPLPTMAPAAWRSLANRGH
jgi:hypothetical protein